MTVNFWSLLSREMYDKYPQQPGVSIIIDDGNKNTTCYSYDQGLYGWCRVIITYFKFFNAGD